MEPAFTTSSSPTRYHRHAETTFGRIADPEEASRRWLPSSRPPRGVEIKTKPHAVVTPPLAHSSSTRSTRSTVRWLRKGFSHTFFASATLKSFQRTLALSRSIEVSRLIVAGTAAQSSRVSARLLPLLLPERVASSPWGETRECDPCGRALPREGAFRRPITLSPSGLPLCRPTAWKTRHFCL